MKELRPCPFCGTCEVDVYTEDMLCSVEFDKRYPNNGRRTYVSETRWYVKSGCVKQTRRYPTETEAVYNWNSRQEETK